ncbi:MAG: U32 family peptidase [Defluviitaleaceae bacterium]|nr:U32 family peptidase [Defluviitaleaceae bacterium]MCL2276211.1 U32 family peptidase [Defluviitaleaceae bacterium]
MKTKPELLAPAGDLEKLKVAFHYGADAVYIGGNALGMRAAAKNFSPDEMREGIAHAHGLGKKVYITANIFAHNEDFDGMADYFKSLQEMGADALIISDLGVFSLAKAIVPDMELHISTQANCTNYAAAAFWQGAGAKRVILARELSLNEIFDIHKQVGDLHIEAFVHGAMCMAYSGRCLISNYLHHRDANGGACIQPCRWEYTLTEKKSNETMHLYEAEKGAGTYLFNARDLCMIEHIPELLKAGIRSFKIEGRMKTSYYVAATVKTYREAIDDYFANPLRYEKDLEYYAEALARLGNGQFSTGFYFGKPTGDDHSYNGDSRAALQDFLALVEERDPATGLYRVEQRNKFSVGDTIEIFRPNRSDHVQTVTDLFDHEGRRIESAPHPKQRVYVKLDTEVQRFDILRKKVVTKS